jgi:hypothetical protein
MMPLYVASVSCVLDDMTISQEDEVSALQSIFDEEFSSISPSHFELVLRFDSLPNPIALLFDDASIELWHLPPLTFELNLPKNYPEEESPHFRLHYDYLPPDRLQTIACELDQLWTPNESIIFTWTELIRETLSKIRIDFLDESKPNECHDERVISNYHRLGTQLVYNQLIDYDKWQSQLQFDRSIQTCPIW